jgi:hypothetical protein
VVLFTPRIVVGVDAGPRQYDVFPDGRFLINAVLDDVTSPITVLQNWLPGRPCRVQKLRVAF